MLKVIGGGFLCACLLLSVSICLSEKLLRERGIYFTKDEAKHIGLEFSPRKIVYQFLKTNFSRSEDLQLNDFPKHHMLVTSFCKSKKKQTGRSCSWEEYYSVLDYVREPFEGFFDPGAFNQKPIQTIYKGKLPKKIRKAADAESCDTIVNPSSKDFFQLIKASHPVIIKGAASSWPALRKWNLEYLMRQWGHADVVASVSPTGDFDGPEDAELWGIHSPNESVIISRPAHLQLKFRDFIFAAQQARKLNITYYLEYFPLKAVDNPKNKNIPRISWASFLNPRYTLLWFGMAGITKPVGRLHFDRFENLMAMISGSKQFIIYGPDQGEELYAATPLRSASLRFTKMENHSTVQSFGDTTEEIAGSFFRDGSQVDSVYNDYHTYSPVNINNPNYGLYPKFKKARKKICKVEKGDMIYVPTEWWHQVTSSMDEEGKSIGVNMFFEPYYKKPGFKTLLKTFLENRYYGHIANLRYARPCSKKTVCFKKKAN